MLAVPAASRLLSVVADKAPQLGDVRYAEDSGTSQATAHVAGVAAQVLSVRPDLVGKPADLKRRMMESALDLGLVWEYQGAGLVDALGILSPKESRRGDGVPQSLARARVVETAREELATPLKLMCCYSHKDELLLTELKSHLSHFSVSAASTCGAIGGFFPELNGMKPSRRSSRTRISLSRW